MNAGGGKSRGGRMNTEELILAEISGPGFRSGEQISGRLEITRSAVWKHIVKLRESGYEIEARPHRGYRLLGRPDKLLPLELAPRLDTRVIGRRIVHYDKLESTTVAARELIESGAEEGTVLVAEAQAAGKGRLGRRWITHPGRSIAMSVILLSGPPPTRMPMLSLATAVAAARAIAGVAGIQPRLKWPNDIYWQGKKLGGVLVEIGAELDRVRWIIDSIGINVNDDFRNTKLMETATSLAEVTGRRLSRLDLAAALITELDRLWMVASSDSARDGGGDLEAYRREFERLDILQGNRVGVITPEGGLDGTASGIDSEGRLLVETGDGSITAVFSGEATLA